MSPFSKLGKLKKIKNALPVALAGHFAKKVAGNPARKKIYERAGIALSIIFIASLFVRYIVSGLPSMDGMDEYTPSLTTKVFDRNGEFIANFAMEQRALLPIEQIPRYMQNAVIAMEDYNFYNHWGISPKGILRALIRDITKQKVAQGASTITQQLSKVILLSPEKKIVRKIREVILALQMEHQFSKEEILQMYLNEIYFGHGAYGVKSAAKIYFTKTPEELTLADCALLTAVIPLPGRYSPFVNPETALARRNLVLARMFELGYITEQEKMSAQEQPLPAEKPVVFRAQAPYFIEHIRKYLEPKYGIDTLWKGGLSVYTTLDLKAQLAGEMIMERNLSEIDTAVAPLIAKMKEKTPGAFGEEVSASTEPVKIQGAYMAMDNKTGAILTMIGGRDYDENKWNRVTQAKRQPGSSFKPFVWMAALQSGYTAASIVDDYPRTYYFDGKNWRLFDESSGDIALELAKQPFAGEKDFQIWVPSNFDKRSMGKMTLRRGLELSRNLVSIDLMDKVGPALVVSVAKKAGVRQPLNPVLSLGLGTEAVTLQEMVNCFATFANSGIKVEPYAVEKVLDINGKVLEQFSPIEQEVFSPQDSFLLINMMRGVVEQGTATRAFALGRPLAGKTGTSQDHRDLWFVGATADITAGAWMGYDDFSTIESEDWTGGSTVVPWWTEITKEVVQNQPIKDFPVPEGITFVSVDSLTGNLALPTSRRKFLEAFKKGTEPKTFSDYAR